MVKREKFYQQCIRLLLVTICTFSFLSAEEACKFKYNAKPELLNNKTLTLPDQVVAMAEHVRVDNVLDETTEGGLPCSLFFIIDNSRSMWNHQPGWNPPQNATDLSGTRFIVTRDLIDTLYKRNPTCEVGIAIFQESLYMDKADDPLFKEVASDPRYRGSFIPLLKLNGMYNGERGHDILKKYLETATYTNISTQPWVGLTYKPYTSEVATHINIGFDAAKQSMTEATYPVRRQFIIFFSDGTATFSLPGVWDDVFVEGADVPTTFTVYFTERQGDSPHDDLVEMTDNIKTNNYSTSNTMTSLWSIETGYDKLMSLLMENVISEIITVMTEVLPLSLQVNTITSPNSWDNVGFLFNDLFALEGENTDFDYNISYHIKKDSVTETGEIISVIDKDTVHDVNFTVTIDPGAAVPDSVELTCWGRKLEFYHNGTLITAADESMDDIEFIKFLKDWIVDHILTVDRKYGPFLNEKGVF